MRRHAPPPPAREARPARCTTSTTRRWSGASRPGRSTTMAEARAAGRVLHRGSPLPGCRVIAGDEQTGTVVADTETGPDGAWELMLPSDDVLIVAFGTDEALGVVAAKPGDELELELTSVAPTHELTVRLEGESMPDWVRPQVRLTPVRVGALDGRVLRWIHAPVRQLSRSALARIVPEDGELRRYVQAGTWWITAEFFEERGVRALDSPEPQSWSAIGARTADGELPPLKGGFEVDVTGPLTVTLELARR